MILDYGMETGQASWLSAGTFEVDQAFCNLFAGKIRKSVYARLAKHRGEETYTVLNILYRHVQNTEDDPQLENTLSDMLDLITAHPQCAWRITDDSDKSLDSFSPQDGTIHAYGPWSQLLAAGR